MAQAAASMTYAPRPTQPAHKALLSILCNTMDTLQVSLCLVSQSRLKGAGTATHDSSPT